MTEIDSYSEDNFGGSSWTINTQHHSQTTLYSAFGQSFDVSTTNNIISVKFYLKRSATGAGELKAQLYASEGTHGSNARPLEPTLAVSDGIDIATGLTTSFTLIEFTFTGAQQYEMQSGTVYCIEVVATTLTSGTVSVGADSSLPTHAGNISAATQGIWGSSSSWDVIFYVYGNIVLIEVNRLPNLGAYGWNSTNEVHDKIKVDSDGILQTS